MGNLTENILLNNENNKTTKDRIQNIKDNMDYNISNKEIISINEIKDNSDLKASVPKKYSYVPKLTLIFSNGEVFDLLSYTTVVQVEINLNDYVFPLISLRLDLPSKYIPRIQFDDDLEIKFELLYNSITEIDTAAMYETLWNINLKKIKQESSPIITDDLLYEENIQYIRLYPLELKMIPKECLEVNKQIFSGVYGNCTISQLLTLITEKLNNKVYIHPPENLKLYDQVIFPPCNIFYAIEYLDQYYGIYDRGLKMFYGFNQSVILPINYNLDTGTNKVKIPFSTDRENGISFYNYIGGGITKIGSDNYISVTPDKVRILDKRHYIKETLGNVVSTYSRDDDAYFEQIREYDYNENSSIKYPDKIKSYINQYNNTNKEKEFLLQSAYTRQIELILNDAILEPESWFKSFSLDFESDNYKSLNGSYSLHGYYFRLSKVNSVNGESEFNVTSAIELKEV